MFCRCVFGNISGGFRGISRKYLNFAGPRPSEISEALNITRTHDFNPELQIKIQFRREPAIDNGGLLRQAYEDAFLALAKGDAGLKMFQGPYERLVPIYRSDNVLNGVFEVLGKMVAHSMIQGRPGFPYLSPVVYWYVATGDLQQGIARASV